MRWRGRRRSTNVEDRRGRSGGRGLQVGGAAAVVIVLVGLLFGVDPGTMTEILGGSEAPPQPGLPQQGGAPQDEEAEFASVVLASTEEVWMPLFAAEDARYAPPTLVLYNEMVQSACGLGSAATGPFYCPGDAQIYLDLSFFHELAQLDAPGDFAAAYVIAHEVGHHVQRLTGTEGQVRSLQRGRPQAEANALSVQMELQADCYAGVWAHHANREGDFLETGDLEEGLRAAAAIGDDRLQRMAGRSVQPETFTHGTSEQRARWFRTGLESGSPEACDTFSGAAGR